MFQGLMWLRGAYANVEGDEALSAARHTRTNCNKACFGQSFPALKTQRTSLQEERGYAGSSCVILVRVVEALGGEVGGIYCASSIQRQGIFAPKTSQPSIRDASHLASPAVPPTIAVSICNLTVRSNSSSYGRSSALLSRRHPSLPHFPRV